MKLWVKIVLLVLAQFANKMTTETLTFTFTDITMDEANLILAGLQELPAKVANPLTQKIQIQAKSQLPQEPAAVE
jgi:hypothetical protein